MSENRPGPCENRDLLAVLERLTASRTLTVAPSILALSPLVALASLGIEGRASYAVALVALGIGVLGAMLEYVILLLFSVARDLAWRGRAGLFSLIRPAAAIGLYITGMGMIIASRIVRGAVEYLYEKPVEDIGCSPPGGARTVLLLGAPLSRFQRCALLRVAEWVSYRCSTLGGEKAPVDLGSVGYDG